MVSLYKIRLVYEPCPSGIAWADADMPDVIEEETVQVEADSLRKPRGGRCSTTRSFPRAV
jgi:hypothetical protein